MPWLLYRWLLFLAILLFVFKDCKGLFIRHTRTGECIKASSILVYKNRSHALPFFVLFTDNCLDEKAKFRYLNSELLHNIATGGTLVYSSTNKDYRNLWAVYKGNSTSGKNYEKNLEHRLKQTAAGYLSFYHKNICAKRSGAYVIGRSCNTGQPQKFTFGTVTAYDAEMTNTHCSPIQRMVVESAQYGNFDKDGTFNEHANIESRCSQVINCRLKSFCDGKSSCERTVDNSLLPSTLCSTTSQIYIKYTCVDTSSYSPAITNEVPQIRLTNQNKGYIEVKDGSIWKKANEENWDAIRQNTLCQHLGFEAINYNDIERKKITRGQQIVTGDLIFSSPQQGITSSCIHLKPSTSSTSTRIPYVKCAEANTTIVTPHDEGLAPDKPRNLTVTNITSDSAVISWLDPQRQWNDYSSLSRFFIKLKKDNTLILNISTGKVNEYEFNNLTPYTTFEIFVAAGDKYYRFGEDSFIAFITSEEAPSGPPLNIRTTSRSSSSLLVTWDPPEKTKRNGVIISYTACVSHSENGVCFQRIFSGEKKWVIGHLNATTKYYIRVFASTKVGHGNYSESKGFFTNARTNGSFDGSTKYLVGIIVLVILLVISCAVIAYLIHRTRAKSTNTEEPKPETTNDQNDSRHIYDTPASSYENVEDDLSTYTALNRPAPGQPTDDHVYAHLNQTLKDFKKNQGETGF